MFVKFDERVKIESVSGDGIVFSDGSGLGCYHSQDCCENVYADFENITETIPTVFIEALRIEVVADSGFNILVYPNIKNLDVYIRLFVPCYNQQNGYYSDELEVVFTNSDMKKTRFDISDAVKDEIE